MSATFPALRIRFSRRLLLYVLADMAGFFAFGIGVFSAVAGGRLSQLGGIPLPRDTAGIAACVLGGAVVTAWAMWRLLGELTQQAGQADPAPAGQTMVERS